MSEPEKACEGGRMLEAWREMAECIACGRCVRWDLQEHPFFGFQNCEDYHSVVVVFEVEGRDSTP